MSAPQAEREARWSYVSRDLEEDVERDESKNEMETEVTARDIAELLRRSEHGLDLEGRLERDTPFATHSESYFEEEIIRLRNENANVRQYAARLQEELGRWQRKNEVLEAMHPDEVAADEDDEETEEARLFDEASGLAPWVTTPHLFSPLLIAYDGRIKELRSMMKTAERQIVQDREHIARLSHENDQLQEQLDEELKKRIHDLEGRTEGNVGAVAGGGVGLVASESLQMLNELVDSLQKENAVLQEQNTIMSQDVERYREQGKERDEQLMVIQKNFQSATTGLKAARNMVQDLKSERDVALNQVKVLNQQISQANVENESLNAEVDDKERQLVQQEKMISKLRNELDELAAKANAESELQEQRLHLSSKRNQELRLELETVRQELDSLREKHRQLRAQNDATTNDCEHMVQVMKTMKQEIEEFKAREASVKAMADEAKSKVESATLEKNQANACETQSRREIARLHDQRAQIAKDNIADTQRAVKEIRDRMQLQIDARNAEIEEYAKQCAQLTEDSERAKREKYEATNRLDRLRKTSGEEIRRLEGAMIKLTERVEHAEGKAMEREADAQKKILESNARITEADQERTEMQETCRSLQQRLQEATAQIASCKNEMKRLSKENETNNNEAIRLRQELATLRLTSDSRIENAEQRVNLETQKYQQRLVETETKLEESRTELENLKQSIERLKRNHGEEMISTVSHFERLVADQKEECARLRARGEDLTAQLHTLQHERTETASVLKNQEHQIRKLDKSLHVAEKRASEAKFQLNELIASEENRVREIGDIRRKIDQAEMQTNKAVRERDAALRALQERNTNTSYYPESEPILSSSRITAYSGLQQQHQPPFGPPPASPSSRSNRLELESKQQRTTPR